MSDQYRIVNIRLRQVRENSVMVDKPHGPGRVSIPRSLIHGSDDLRLDAICFGSEGIDHTLRVREWKAEELGLAG